MEIKKLLNNFADITYTPVTVFTKETDGYISQSYPDNIPYLDILCKKYPAELLDTELTANTIIFEDYLLYGYVKVSEDQFVIVGPTSEMPTNNNTISIILRKLSLPHTDIKDMVEYFEYVPKMSILRFAKIVNCLNEFINENGLRTKAILPKFFQQNVTENVSDSHDSPLSVKNEDFERALYAHIYTGQYNLLKEFLNKTSYDGPIQTISEISMKQYKYLVIVSITLASRTAIQAGVSCNAALSQSDVYMRKVDEATTYQQLFDLHRQMLLVYAKMVADYRLGAPASALLLRVHNYIGTHLYEKITTAEIASALNMNRAYLSTQFKAETGVNLADYINMIKVDEAKRLLISTDKTLIEIANALCFSSQSYFNEVFKKFVGIMPKKFRETSLYEIINGQNKKDDK